MSYAGWGNRRVTKEDYRLYKQHQNDQNTVHSLADIPNAVAENMRRLEGEGSGTISSSDYQGTMEKLKNPKLSDYISAIRSEQTKLLDEIVKATGKSNLNELFTSIDQSQDAMILIAGVNNASAPLTRLLSRMNNPDEIRIARASLDEEIENLNSLLFKVFGNDKRLHVPVLHMISLLESAGDYVDSLYEKVDYGANKDGELGNIRSKVKFQEFSATTDGDINIMMTPSHNEAYIQIYRDPDTAIRKYSE
ncbi:MAG: hypothetical protein IKP86_10730 [Anaerolineaceae bacterium]|nr:hypothetical protein [Anaerolineaceae bacterium]